MHCKIDVYGSWGCALVNYECGMRDDEEGAKFDLHLVDLCNLTGIWGALLLYL